MRRGPSVKSIHPLNATVPIRNFQGTVVRTPNGVRLVNNGIEPLDRAPVRYRADDAELHNPSQARIGVDRLAQHLHVGVGEVQDE